MERNCGWCREHALQDAGARAMCEVARCRTRGGQRCGVAATGASEHLLGWTAAGRVPVIRRTAAWRTKARHPLRLIPAGPRLGWL